MSWRAEDPHKKMQDRLRYWICWSV